MIAAGSAYGAGGEIEDRDHPLVLRYRPDPDWLKPLHLPPAASQRHEGARAQIAAIALDMWWNSQQWISYSRNRDYYARRGTRYDELPDLYRYSIIPPAVDALAAGGCLENMIAPRDPHCGWQSRFRATLALIEALGAMAPPLAKPKQRALIQLRDEQKRPIDYPDTELTWRKRHRAAEINEGISAQKIELPDGIGESHGHLMLIGEGCINLTSNFYYRIFNQDFQHGGRFYGHWTQSLPKAVRGQLTIEGEPVAEPDYHAHPPTAAADHEGSPRMVCPTAARSGG